MISKYIRSQISGNAESTVESLRMGRHNYGLGPSTSVEPTRSGSPAAAKKQGIRNEQQKCYTSCTNFSS